MLTLGKKFKKSSLQYTNYSFTLDCTRMENHDPSSEILRSELARLHDREATLTHLLSLEREKRIKAEHLVEVERLSCFELGHKLVRQALQTTKSSASSHSANVGVKSSQLANCNGHCNGGYTNSQSDIGSVECSIDISSSKHSKSNGSYLVDNDSGDKSIMSSNMSPLSAQEDLATSIFSQLPADLRHMLGFGDEQEAREEETFFNAQSAVLGNDPDSLRRHASLPSLQNHKGDNLLEVSCERGHDGCVRVLLEAGWSPNKVAANKSTPLHICAKSGHLSSVKVLLHFGADQNAADDNEQTPIFLALRGGHETTARFLLEAGSSLTTKTKGGLTLLHAAVQGNMPNTLRLLITHLRSSLEGSKFKQILNSADSSGSTPLHTAVSRGHRECVGVLCACEEVSVSQRDRWNQTPMDVTTDEECRQLLRNRESKLALVLVESPDRSNGQQGRLVIGQLFVLPHHRLSDIELLVADLLSQYCDTLRGHTLYLSGEKQPSSDSSLKSNVVSKPTGAKSLSERVEAECELAAALKDDSAVLKAKKEAYLQDCSRSVRNVREKISSMDLTGDSVAAYQVGSVKWRSGELDRTVGTKTLLSIFNEAKLKEKSSQDVIRITLKGLQDGCLDQLALQLMIPMARLREYINLVEQYKALIIHGSQGSGKTQLARALASYIKATKRKTQVLYFSLHPSFQRDDLFRLLHLNGLLIQHNEGPDHSKGTNVIILDDLSSVHMPSVLAELLTSLEYQGAEHPMWVSDVYARDGSLLYPCGQYHLHSSTYFIATTSSESAGGEWVDQFAHISLGLQTSSNVLMHHLSARLVHALRGVALHPTLPLCRMVWWVFQTWVLYNDFVRRVGLEQLSVGVRRFTQCTVESDAPEAVTSWLVSLWNHHLAPAIRSTLLTPSPLSPPSQSHTFQDFKLISKCLSACLEVTFRPACPLSYEAREKCMEQLREAIESGDLEKRGEKERADVQEDTGTVTNSQSTSSNKTQTSSTPPTSHPTHKPPIPPQPGSMVSYEDMLRDSPRNKAKKDKHRTNSVVSKPSKSPSQDSFTASVPAAPVEGVTLRSNNPRKSTLRKFRSKTISLFSKDNHGFSTLPRLFRRGSRTSLNLSAASEEMNHSDTHPAKEAKQMEDMFSLLTTANSNRFDDQRSLSPSPPPPNPGHDAVDDKRKDLDSFLDMLSSVDGSRIDEQRSPPPPPTPTKSRSKKRRNEATKTVPKYTLPTGSPHRGARMHHPSKLLGIRDSSPPAMSTPNLVTEVASEQMSYHTSSHPVQRKFTNASASSYDSDLLFTDDRPTGHCEPSHAVPNTGNNVYRQHQHSPRSEPDSLLFRRAGTHDTFVTSEPLRRRKPKLDLINTHHSPVKATPSYGRSPASPLTMAMYSSPRNSPSVPQSTREQGDSGPVHSSVGGVRSIKASSVADMLDIDELGALNEFDLFRAASEGDLMQSSTKENFLEYEQESEDCYKKDQVSISHDVNEKPGYGYQSSPEEDRQSDTNSLVRTSGYVSDNNTHAVDLPRQRSYSTSVSYHGQSHSNHYHPTDRRHSTAYDQKKDLYSPTNTLPRGRRSSDASSVFNSNLLYSASLGFDSLTRLSSSRDHLSNAGAGGSLTEDLTEM